MSDARDSPHKPAEAAVMLTARHSGSIDVGTACDALARPDWFGTPVEETSDDPTRRRYLVDLALPLAGQQRSLQFRKAAFLDIGPVRRGVADCEVDLAWFSATFAPLFPVFFGQLRVSETGIALEGAYTPPFGSAGLLIDRALLHHFATVTARWFVDEIATRLGGYVPT